MAWIKRNHDLDIIVLTEVKKNEGCKYICDQLNNLGYKICVNYDDRDYGVLIASKFDFVEVVASRKSSRYCHIKLKEKVSVDLVALYVPSNDRKKIERKREFLKLALENLTEIDKQGALVLCGDFNTVKRTHEPKYTMFRKWEYGFFDDLNSLALIDVDDYLYPNEQRYSWYGRTGNGYKYDYFFISKQLSNRLVQSYYTDQTIKLKLTDHCAQILIINDGEMHNGHSK